MASPSPPSAADGTLHPAEPRIEPRRRDATTPGGVPVIGIGASAGGLEAFTALLAQLHAQSGYAFVLVQHLDPKGESQLADLMSRITRLPVRTVADGMTLTADHIYIMPPSADVALVGNVLNLVRRSKAKGAPHLPIDRFFRSLAAQRGPGAVGVVLSGNGADGTLGLAEIRAAGGITFAQDEASAKFTGMPVSAWEGGHVDRVAPPEEIGRELMRLAAHVLPESARTAVLNGESEGESAAFQTLLVRLRYRTRVDFTHYRDTTLRRRIARRMMLLGVRTMREYVAHIDREPAELDALYRDLLITVTSFFRDPDMFESLKREVFPRLVPAAATGPLRLWAAACSTGQEAYSLGMALLEYLDDRLDRPVIQIFATDIVGAPTLDRARAGLYPESIEAEVSPQRLARFFVREEGGYRVARHLRDMCLFARHDVTADPPFSRLDLISCRNMLIYVAPALQQRILDTFHYALKPDGVLILGSAETVGARSDSFEPIDRAHKIYMRTSTMLAALPQLMRPIGRDQPQSAASTVVPALADFQREADRLLMTRYAPAGVLVNDSLRVLEFRGRTGQYLEPAAGEASFSLLKMARGNLALSLAAAVNEALLRGESVTRPGLQMLEAGRAVHTFDLEVAPIQVSGSSARCCLVLFHAPGDQRPPESAAPPPPLSPAARDAELEQLRRDVVAAANYLQLVVERHEAVTEALRGANEENRSSNEELQSSIEELETAKEEVISANEELTTLNEELQSRNAELNQLNADLHNLFASVRIPIVMLSMDLRIRRFNPAAAAILHLIDTDEGRPLMDLAMPVQVPDLERLLHEAISGVAIRAREVQDRDGRWFELALHPYRTRNQRIDGAVLSLVDIHATKEAQSKLRAAGDFARAIVGTIRAPLLVLDGALRVESANQSFHDVFGVTPGSIEGCSLFELEQGAWNLASLRTLLEGVLADHTAFEDFEVDQAIEGVGARTLMLNGRVLHQGEGTALRVLLAIEDVTERRRIEGRLRDADRRKDEFIATLSHELRNPLGPIRQAAALLKVVTAPERKAWAIDMIERQVEQMTALLNDLLDSARIAGARLTLRRERAKLLAIVQSAAETAAPLLDAKSHALSLAVPAALELDADPLRLTQILTNLLTNAAKYTDPHGTIHLEAKAVDGAVEIRVRDSGIGISAAQLPRIFDMYWQAPQSSDMNAPECADASNGIGASSARHEGGLGIGLALTRDLVRLHGGSIEATSAGVGRGSEFVVRIPNEASRAAPGTDSDPGAGSAEHLRPVSRRILVVEDNPDSLSSLIALLELNGHTVRGAGDGARALDVAASFRPDVVLLDIGLPTLNGYDVARRIRAEPWGKVIALVAVTGWGQPGDKLAAAAAGFDHHIVKPLELDQLERLLAAAAR